MRAQSSRIIVLGLSLALALVAPEAIRAGSIWTDANGDGLPDAPGTLVLSAGDIVSVDLWIDSQSFTWTNYLVYAEWTPGCFQFLTGEYLLTSGQNFPIDTFSHPSAVGFGGIEYSRQGVDAMARIDLRALTAGVCCVTPMIDPDNAYYIFSQLGNGTAYLVFTSNPNSCWSMSSEPGACCFADGSCSVLLPDECTAAGGTPQGGGTTCETVTCEPLPPTGACCLPSGACTGPVTAVACAASGGTYQGDDTSCATVTCPVPTGACCLPSGACDGPMTAADCAAAGGIYWGNGTDCATIVCPPPPPPTGACCLPAPFFCQIRSEAGCAAAGGTYMGDGTGCTPDPCPPPPPPTGACCYPSGACDGPMTAEACAASGGNYRGDGTNCATVVCPPPPPPTGACCFTTPPTCQIRSAASCASAGGTYQGDGTVCSPNPCPPPPPPTGACCVDGTCIGELTRDDCDAAGGIYRGDGTTCATPNICVVPGGCGGAALSGTMSVFPLRESAGAPRGSSSQGEPCALAASTNGTAANYRWYNLCSGYLWIYSAFTQGEGVGVLFGGAQQPSVNGGNDVKRVITYFRNVLLGYSQTVDVHVDVDSNGDGCPDAGLASDLDLDPGLRWNCSDFGANIPCGITSVIVRTTHDGGAAPTFATDGAFNATCDPNAPGKSYYYGINGSACTPWCGPDNTYDNFLYWLILDTSAPCVTAVESTTWGRIKGMFR